MSVQNGTRWPDKINAQRQATFGVFAAHQNIYQRRPHTESNEGNMPPSARYALRSARAARWVPAQWPAASPTCRTTPSHAPPPTPARFPLVHAQTALAILSRLRTRGGKATASTWRPRSVDRAKNGECPLQLLLRRWRQRQHQRLGRRGKWPR